MSINIHDHLCCILPPTSQTISQNMVGTRTWTVLPLVSKSNPYISWSSGRVCPSSNWFILYCSAAQAPPTTSKTTNRSYASVGRGPSKGSKKKTISPCTKNRLWSLYRRRAKTLPQSTRLFEMHLSFFSSAGKTFLFSLMNNKNITYPGMITYCVANQKSRVHQFMSCSSKMVTPYTTGFSFVKHSNHSACCIQALLFDE